MVKENKEITQIRVYKETRAELNLLCAEYGLKTDPMIKALIKVFKQVEKSTKK